MNSISVAIPGTLSCSSISGNGSGITGIPINSLAGTSISGPSAGDNLVYSGSVWQNNQSRSTSYVNSALGSDSTGNGSLQYPYASISAAVAGLSSQYIISIADGTYSANFTIPSGVSLRSTSGNNYAALVSGTATFAAPSGTSASSYYSQAQDITFTGTVNVDSTASNVQSWISFCNCVCSSTSTLNITGGTSNITFVGRGLLTNGGLAVSGQTGISLYYSLINKVANVAMSSNGTSILNVYGSSVFSNLQFSASSGARTTVNFYRTLLGGSLSTSGAGTVTISADSLPIGSLSVATGHSYTLINKPTFSGLADTAIVSPVRGNTAVYSGSAWTNQASSGTNSTSSFFTNTGSWTTSSSAMNWNCGGSGTTVYFTISGTQGTSASTFTLTLPVPTTLTASNLFVGLAGFFVNGVASSGIQITGNGSGTSYSKVSFTIPAQGSSVPGSVSGNFQYSTV